MIQGGAFIKILFFIILIIISVNDLYEKQISNNMCILILILGIVSYAYYDEISFGEMMLGLIFPSVIFLFSGILYSGSIGGGDVKFVAASGFFMGVTLIIRAVLIGLFICLIVQLTWLIRKRKFEHKKIPLGPYLSAGMIIAYFL